MKRSQPMIIYIDNDFSSVEEKDISHAMQAWEKVSGYTLQFFPIWNTEKPIPYRKQHKKLKRDQGIFLWKVDKNDKQQFSQEMKDEYEKTHGLFAPGPGDNSGNIVLFAKQMSREHFYQVALHEFGHFLGLNHTNKSKLAVMANHTQSSCITNYDAAALCKLYGCKPKPECIAKRFISSDK